MKFAFVGIGLAVAVYTWVQSAPAQPKMDMAEMMASGRKFTQPSEAHKKLEALIGSWANINVAG